MRTELNIETMVVELNALEKDFTRRLDKELNPKDGIIDVAALQFLQIEHKKVTAKIEVLKWVLAK